MLVRLPPDAYYFTMSLQELSDQNRFSQLVAVYADTSKSRRVSSNEFVVFCMRAIDAKKESPARAAQIAEMIVSLGSMTPSDDPSQHALRAIRDLAADLEVPDGHVYTGDGLSVSQKWSRLELLVSELA